eukprot:TRINITY_DN4078_c0_g2_i3.p1 TRINITY_DN4078_c0_g2~~TRINITY_DN4078_c0_g2_i3.p1  ORF type:complete len:611 (+),score=126.35 TRINITY_DN4078_c0_g2_i3:105-1937(+)
MYSARQLAVFSAFFSVASAVRTGATDEDFEGSQTNSSGRCPGPSTLLMEDWDIRDACQQCVEVSGCKWCPLEQRCVSSCTFGCSSCNARPGFHDDKKMKTAFECHNRPLPWVHKFKMAYGGKSDGMKWYNDPRHEDAKKCLHWALDWDLDTMGVDVKSDSKEEDGLARFGCISAIMREGMLALLGKKLLPSQNGHISTVGGPELVANSLMQEDANETVKLNPGWYTMSTTWKPELCNVLQLKFGGDVCYIRTWMANKFRQVIAKFPQTYERLLAAVEAGPLQSLNPGTGKSGSGFANIGNGDFKLKLGLKSSSKVNEPNNLMNIMLGDENSMSLPEHLEENPASLLNKVFGLFKIKLHKYESYAVVIEDAFYKMDSVAKKANVEFTRYDLKGDSRSYGLFGLAAGIKPKEKGWCLNNKDFENREQMSMMLSDEQCLKLRSTVASDCKFLDSKDMIDYSLLLMSAKSGQQIHCSDGIDYGAPECMEQDNHLYTMSIIDYLNDATFFKNAESFFKGGKFTNYGRQITAFTGRICRTQAEKEIRKQVNEKIGSAKKAFQQIDTDNSGKIDSKEILKFLTDNGFTAEETHQVISSLDLSGDEVLDLSEFEELFK